MVPEKSLAAKKSLRDMAETAAVGTTTRNAQRASRVAEMGMSGPRASRATSATPHGVTRDADLNETDPTDI